jgi:hypothetical protein
MKKERCMMCGRILTNPESIARGIGPVCYRKYVCSLSGRKPPAVLSAISQQTLQV